MKKSDVVEIVLRKAQKNAMGEKGLGYAPSNIALVKYWGKRDPELNLPRTSSLSIALPEKGAQVEISRSKTNQDVIILNKKEINIETEFFNRTLNFLNLFRNPNVLPLKIDIIMNIPVAAGLASSACGFAALTCALNDLFKWRLSLRDLSILARLGSGSASRSLWNGFVEWHAGVQADGMDCYSEPLLFEWPELYLGVYTISSEAKYLSSREAMQRTINSSLLYANWPRKVTQDIIIIKQALNAKNFALLAGTAESNALNMHATMLSSWPPICYFLPETIATMHKVWQLRRQGLELYFTQDAGPNIKLIFLEKDLETIKNEFPAVEPVKTFERLLT